ncbi:NAD(P)H-dependent oxidoreductase [Luteimonas sp. MJ246]|uniref:flavodoxin family protein n=1 Tax=Luteimonas sp. MJ174 TaxID=3129237 RepID=UPI0031BA9CA6
MALRAFGLNCTLKSSPGESSTQKMLDLLLQALGKHDVTSTSTRVADHDVKPGVSVDEGDGDAWPGLRGKVMEADIVVLATPIWLGQPSSVVKRVLERMNAFLGEGDDRGRFPTFGKVAVVGVVGNEDGAHHVTAELYQALADVGFTIPASGGAYWVGEAMQKTDFKDLPEVPEKVTQSVEMAASNAAHLARLLKAECYPGVG